MLLQDKVAVVSGVGPGLGKEIALALVREGASVVMGARTEAYLRELADEIDRAGGQVAFAPTDITDVEQCRRLVGTAVDRFGRVDALVNNAFVPDAFELFEDVDLDKWRHIFDVNVFGSLQLTKEVIGPMKAQGGGSIVFINSMVIRKILPHQGGYAASKGALMTAAQVLAKELGPHRIRVNSVVPGWMWGPSVEGLFQWRARKGPSVQEQYDAVAKDIPLGLIPPDDDCANAVVFFVSDLAAVVTGQALDVNGGEVFH
ncbi:MAG: SDR family oxidoreductase [Actinobacteria bacterium]|nr:MAG: SDR family oxidoreductase [Actinomycetota bacterium]